MTNKILISILIVVVIAGIGGYLLFTSSSPNSLQVADNSSLNPSSSSSSGQAQKTKLADTRYAQYAFLISTDKYDSATQAALAGFTVDRKVLADGTQQITLNAQNPEYQTQSYTVKPGQKLYFIETSMGDDPGGQEFNLGDDRAVIVDSDGYIVQ